MPLSEEELRLLEQMERELAAEDPKFVATLQGRTLRRSTRLRLVVAGIAFIGGVGLLMGGVMAPDSWQILLGTLGFLVMLASATLGLAAWKGHHGPEQTASPQSGKSGGGHPFQVIDGGRSRRPRKQKQQHGSGTFMQRMEQRWQDRRNQGF